MALAVSLDHLGERVGNARAKILGAALDEATTQYLLQNKSPSRKVHQLDNRGSHFYLALFWAEAPRRGPRQGAGAQFAPLAQALRAGEDAIVAELNEGPGRCADIEGYYWPDDLASKAMRPVAP